METYQELQERLNKVILQKDRLQERLANMVDRFWSCMANGIFEGGGFYPEKEKDKKCEGGKTLREVKWHGCEKARDGNCCIGCHLKFDMMMMMEAVLKATDVLNELDEAMLKFSPDEIPEFNHKLQYKVSTKWFCRKMLRLIFQYTVGKDNCQIGGNKAVGESMLRLICFGLDTVGYGKSVVEFIALKELEQRIKKDNNGKDEIIQEVKKHEKEFSNFFKMTKDAVDVHKQYTDVVKKIKKNPDRALKYISLLALLLFMEFDFCHKYPGADNGVYKGAFESVAYLCFLAMKLKEGDRIGILDFVNGTDSKHDVEKQIRKVVK